MACILSVIPHHVQQLHLFVLASSERMQILLNIHMFYDPWLVYANGEACECTHSRPLPYKKSCTFIRHQRENAMRVLVVSADADEKNLILIHVRINSEFMKCEKLFRRRSNDSHFMFTRFQCSIVLTFQEIYRGFLQNIQMTFQVDFKSIRFVGEWHVYMQMFCSSLSQWIITVIMTFNSWFTPRASTFAFGCWSGCNPQVYYCSVFSIILYQFPHTILWTETSWTLSRWNYYEPEATSHVEVLMPTPFSYFHSAHFRASVSVAQLNDAK